LKVNSAVLVALKGFKEFEPEPQSSFGRLSVIVMLPSPTLLFPAHG